MNLLGAIFLGLFSHPDLVTECEKFFNDVAHGEGGIAKVEKAASDLGALSQTALGIAAAAKQAGA